MPREQLRCQALVIARRDVGEADRQVILLTRDFGKLDALARGARRSHKRFLGCLELFARIEALIEEGPRGRPALVEASLLDAREGLRGSLLALAQASYLCDLVDALAGERDPAPGVYDLLAGTLERMERGPLRAAELRAFEIRLLGAVGFAPALDACVGCGEAGRAFRLDPERGGIVCSRCQASSRARPLSPAVLVFLRELAAGRVPEPAARGTLGPARVLLSLLVDEHLSRPLPSRKFLEQVAREAAGEGGQGS